MMEVINKRHEEGEPGVQDLHSKSNFSYSGRRSQMSKRIEERKWTVAAWSLLWLEHCQLTRLDKVPEEKLTCTRNQLLTTCFCTSPRRAIAPGALGGVP